MFSAGALNLVLPEKLLLSNPSWMPGEMAWNHQTWNCASSQTLGQQVWITVISQALGSDGSHSLAPLAPCTCAHWHTCEMVTPHEWEMLGKTLPTPPRDLAIVSLYRQQQQYTALGRICHEFALSVEQKRSRSQLESHLVCCRENLNVQAL